MLCIINTFLIALWCIVGLILFLDSEHGGQSSYTFWLLPPVLFIHDFDPWSWFSLFHTQMWLTSLSHLKPVCSWLSRCSVMWKWASVAFLSSLIKKSFNYEASYTANITFLFPYSSFAQTICNNLLVVKATRRDSFLRKIHKIIGKLQRKVNWNFLNSLIYFFSIYIHIISFAAASAIP